MDSRLPSATADQARWAWRFCSISTMTLIAHGTRIETLVATNPGTNDGSTFR